MEERWFGKAFQIFEAADENDLEAAMCSGEILFILLYLLNRDTRTTG